MMKWLSSSMVNVVEWLNIWRNRIPTSSGWLMLTI